MNQFISEEQQKLAELCDLVRNYFQQNEYQQCRALIFDAMAKYPHSPEPHNLIGIVLENEGDHRAAMKHFRAAWALDPTYIPARHNLDRFASFDAAGKWAFDRNDCSGCVNDNNSL